MQESLALLGGIMEIDMNDIAAGLLQDLITGIAFHEAGHAVVGYKLGIYFTYIDMKTDDEIHSLTESFSFENLNPDDFGCVHFDDPKLELLKTEPSQLKSTDEFHQWVETFRINAIKSLAGEIAQYKRPNSLENESLRDFLEGKPHHQELTEMLDAAFYESDFSLSIGDSADSIMEGCITRTEKMVLDNWYSIEVLAKALLEKRNLYENKVMLIIHEAEKNTTR